MSLTGLIRFLSLDAELNALLNIESSHFNIDLSDLSNDDPLDKFIALLKKILHEPPVEGRTHTLYIHSSTLSQIISGAIALFPPSKIAQVLYLTFSRPAAQHKDQCLSLYMLKELIRHDIENQWINEELFNDCFSGIFTKIKDDAFFTQKEIPSKLLNFREFKKDFTFTSLSLPIEPLNIQEKTSDPLPFATHLLSLGGSRIQYIESLLRLLPIENEQRKSYTPHFNFNLSLKTSEKREEGTPFKAQKPKRLNIHASPLGNGS